MFHFVRFTSYEWLPYSGNWVSGCSCWTVPVPDIAIGIQLYWQTHFAWIEGVLTGSLNLLFSSHYPVWPFSSSGDTATHWPDAQKVSGVLQGMDQNHLWNVGVVFLSLSHCVHAITLIILQWTCTDRLHVLSFLPEFFQTLNFMCFFLTNSYSSSTQFNG